MCMNETLQPVILCGGHGTRLWPLSTTSRPKQLLSFLGDDSLLARTVDRLGGFAAPILVCGAEYADAIAAEVPQAARIIVEPVPRNTAPAIALAAYDAIARGDDPVLLVVPSDHVVADRAAWQTALQQAAEHAADGHIVTLGIQPDAPLTDYGYLQVEPAMQDGAYSVQQFIEKPDEATAKQLLQHGDVFWNSGVFVMRASTYIAALQTHAPAIAAAAEKAIQNATQAGQIITPNTHAFTQSPDVSVDYAVMEKLANIRLIPLEAGWCDIGSWQRVWQQSPQDKHGVATVGKVQAVDTHNSYIHASHRHVSVQGMKDVVVVETADEVLVMHKDSAPDLHRLTRD